MSIVSNIMGGELYIVLYLEQNSPSLIRSVNAFFWVLHWVTPFSIPLKEDVPYFLAFWFSFIGKKDFTI